MVRLKITWYGHSTITALTPEGRKIIVDPFMTGNPACPPELRNSHDFDIILVTHGHADHIGDAYQILNSSDASVLGIYEMANYFKSLGIPENRVIGFNYGGTVEIGGLKFTMTNALHSGLLYEDALPVNVGPPVGYVVHLEDDRKVYFAGDTDIFSEMQFIGEFYSPFLAVLPIDGYYNMSPKAAARAAQLLQCQEILPVHHSTFPILKGKPQMLREELDKIGLNNVVVHKINPGESIEL